MNPLSEARAAHGRDAGANADEPPTPLSPLKRHSAARRSSWPHHVLNYSIAVLAGGVFVWLAVARGWLPARSSAAEGALNPLTAPAKHYVWTDQPPPAFPVPPYARFLKDVVIVLDPGHGGDAHRPNWKRGPTGLREAEVNLRVAQYLREFLDAAGARSLLTREADVDLDSNDKTALRKRIEIANRRRADLFLSIHHNSVADQKKDPHTNYTSVWYHAGPDHSPASLCAARYLLTGLNEALRLEEHLECALLNDTLIYPDSGFGVLRQAEVPAVLSEASFYSNPEEEERLRDPLYLRREAYGLFLGLARWAQAGLPRVQWVETSNGAASRNAGGASNGRTGAAARGGSGQTVTIALDDGFGGRGGWGGDKPRIRADSIVVKLDGRRIDFTADWSKRLLRVTLPAPGTGPRRLYVDFENIFGQHVLHPWVEVD